MNHRHFIVAASAVLLCTNVSAQGASNYPTKPVKLVVGFPAGQATDIIARMVSERMAKHLGQPIVVENKPGQAGGLALGYLAQQTPDGYTVSFANTGAVITNQFVQKSLSYSPEKLQPVALLGDIPLVLVARGDGKIKSLKDFVDQARANPGKLTYSTPGNGTTSHLAMESLKQATGINVLHVPYTGSSRSLTDLMAGNVDVSFDTITTVQPFAESGRLKALAIGATERVGALPKVPTLAESGYRDIIGAVWIGAFVPNGTPATVIRRLESEIGQAVKDPAISQRLNAVGLYVRYADAAGFAKMLVTDTPKIRKVVQLSGAKAD
ncbi:Bug family tripartite tricarboxylate transporter substrate binding protein [Cupriavidus consociatus]|uniref:Bug family tripartite tricarboxylate transporter substrate binding protein n=1 Tax=Cupriavidus consociatus TaxID=2821357 RepID=UPI001AE700B8|nr:MULTISPECIES: tripartite tricarboxylate transporter substrate binding protein [unclassified Cupriavidus]MBP0620954.1 tripartite tricarboxylate transporter substrate binding protein [Cupriavidus sp. LEh25]MDK2657623.1 tripartite tricarboxylate transporter substrate binding protein [Cupriavidus sp. LEh21]